MPPQVVRAGSPTAGRALEGQLSLDAFLVPLPSAPLFNVNTWVVINFFFTCHSTPSILVLIRSRTTRGP